MIVDRRSTVRGVRPVCVTVTFGFGLLLGAVVLGSSAPLEIGLGIVCSMWVFYHIYRGRPTIFSNIRNVFRKGS